MLAFMPASDWNKGPYSDLEFQLLVELRHAFLKEPSLLPMSTLRILRVRGWVTLPLSDECLSVEAIATDEEDDDDDALIDSDSMTFAPLTLTPVGRREMELFGRLYGDDVVFAVLAEDDDPAEDPFEHG